MLQIRKIKPEDVQFIMDIAKENNCPEGKLLSNIESFLICENDNKKCGCGCMVISGEKGYMGWMLVEAGSRRQRLGSAIIKALLNIADINGIKDVYATGLCGEFMSSLGFEADDRAVVKDDMREVLGLEGMDNYHVSLEGYFKPCSVK